MEHNKKGTNSFIYKKDMLRFIIYRLLISCPFVVVWVLAKNLFNINFTAWICILCIVVIAMIALSFAEFYKFIYPVGCALNNLKILISNESTPYTGPNIKNDVEKLSTMMQTTYKQQYSLELLQKQTELDALQSQINPHFLYNTLDAIRGQALEEGSELTSDMIEALSTLLRYTISQRSDLVTLGQEIKSVDNFMIIQQFRFENRFVYDKYIEHGKTDLLMCPIPKLTLQPIVENAISHGIENMVDGGKIFIEVFSTQSRLEIKVTDNGTGMEEATLEELRAKLRSSEPVPAIRTKGSKGTGIAVNNVNARIKLAFGDEYGINVYSTKGIGTQVQISLPLLGDENASGSFAREPYI